jgi:hypothetical protein
MNDTFRCIKCRRNLPLRNFHIKKDNRTGRASMCRECKSVHNFEAVKRHRQVVRDAKDVPCMDCGVCWPIECMDLDYRAPAEKTFNLATTSPVALPPLQAVKDEIAKCDVVCANCHRIRIHLESR